MNYQRLCQQTSLKNTTLHNRLQIKQENIIISVLQNRFIEILKFFEIMKIMKPGH